MVKVIVSESVHSDSPPFAPLPLPAGELSPALMNSNCFQSLKFVAHLYYHSESKFSDWKLLSYCLLSLDHRTLFDFPGKCSNVNYQPLNL